MNCTTMKKTLSIAASALFTLMLLASAASAASAAPKTLVAYFSVTGQTEEIAGYVADSIGAPIYKITPAVPYTEDDISQTARRSADSRVRVENDDDSARPELAGELPDVSDVEVIFVGHPIWYGKVPKAVRTFLESIDLSNKTIVTFCTSGSSEIGKSSEDMSSSFADSTKLVVGRSFRGSKRPEVTAWINGLELGYEAK